MTAPLPPRLLVLTDRRGCDAGLPATVARAVDAGARAVVLREKDLPASQRQALADEVAAILAPVGGLLILAGAATASAQAMSWPPDVPGPALHLAATDELPTPRPVLVGRSCHDETEAAEAAAQGCDYITLSPVFLTASKPGYGPPLGLDRLGALCRQAPPAYALGGIWPATAAACVDAGARGVAVMGPIMRDPSIVAAYLAALPEVTE